MRTDSDAVGLLIELDESLDVTPFIETANALVTEVCAGVVDGDGALVYDAARLELIERWLAAHFYAIRDPRVANETARGVGASYQFQLGLNLNVTTYGQQAAMLDTAGGLAALGKQAEDGKARRPVSLFWLGSTLE